MTVRWSATQALATLRFRPAVALSAVLLAGTLGVFWPLRHAAFIEYDDNLYVSENPHLRDGLTWESVRWAVSADLTADSPNADYWAPLTFLSHLAVAQLFGMAPAAHHLVNVAVHGVNAVLLLLLLRRMTGALWPSAFVAALFAVHPLHVESVAWVSERKDVLSGFFFMLTLLAYARYAERPGVTRYGVVALAFASGLMAKPMLITVPFVLLLLDYWPLGRLSLNGADEGATWREGWRKFWRLAWEKAPLALLSAASGLITYLAARREGAVYSLEQAPLLSRLEHALVSYAAYLGKMVWPEGLAVLYPYPRAGVPLWQAAGAGLLLAGFSVLAIRQRRKRPYVIVGWLWYLVMLVPVIGLVQAGDQAMADRYTYLPLIGPFLIGGWALSECAATRRRGRVFLAAAGVGLVVGAAVCARAELRYWQNGRVLFERALQVTKENYIADNNLGVALRDEGKRQEALDHFAEAIRIKPDFGIAHNNMGTVLADQGRHDEAMIHFTEAVRLSPNLAQARSNLGKELARRGRAEAAIGLFTEALRLDPYSAQVHSDLGLVLSGQGRVEEAIAQFNEALRLNPRLALVHNNLGMALGNTGRLDEAVDHFAEALRLDPTLALAHMNLGTAYDKLGRYDEAVLEFQAALTLDPGSSAARMNLERALEKKRGAVNP